MTTPQQTQDMDAKQIAERHLIERYLAGELSETDSEAFEALVTSQPELAMQIEHVARMKVGLHVLRRRGELTRLLQEHPRSKHRTAWLATAAAASLVIVAFVVLKLSSPPLAVIASSLEGLSDKRGQSRIAATYLLTSARAATAPAQISVFKDDADAIELRFDAAARTDDRFSVEILRVEGDSLRSIARASEVHGSADGSVAIYVAASVLTPGNYLFRLTPAGGEVSQEFAAQVGGS